MKWQTLGASLLSLALGCSYVELPYPSSVSTNGTAYMIARTMELGNILGAISYNIQVVPTHVSGGRYGYVGAMNIIHAPVVGFTKPFEGMNEAGLTISALDFEAVYQRPEAGVPSVEAEDIVGNVLAHHGSVEEVLNYLASVRVVTTGFEKMVVKVHWAIHDASGRSVVVEYVDGQRMVHENTPRVMTNDPELTWHWRNLNTYSNLNPKFPTQNDFLQVEAGSGVGTVPRAVGHGWNLFGLPGDMSPPSRFVRMFYLRGYALHAQSPKDFSDAVVLGTALLNNVFIPYGTVAADPQLGPGVDRPEFTPYGVLKSPAERKIMFRAYRNTQWRLIDLRKLNFAQAQSWPIEDGTLGIEDITEKASSTGMGHMVA
jgi:choloylglycine hydrolase